MVDFAERLTGLLNSSAVSTALGVASRVGLLAALETKAATVTEIAHRAGLSERYAQEMLAVLVCAKIVEMGPVSHDRPENLYSLPDSKKAALDSMSLYFEEMPLLIACAFDEVVRDAKEGAGISSNRYDAFGKWMGVLSDKKHESQLLHKFIPALGQDVVSVLQSGAARVLDVGCGEGAVACLLADAFPKCHVVGIDVRNKSIDKAIQNAASKGLQNVEFLVDDVATLCPKRFPDGGFDLILAFDVIHDCPKPAEALREIRRVLKPNAGVFAMVDIRAHTNLEDNLGHPFAPFLYTVSLMHCMPQGLRDGGPGLGMMWGRERACEMMKAAGFIVNVLELEFDTFNDCYLCKRQA